MCSIAMRLREYRAAERAVGRRVEQNKGETNAWAWAQLGRIAYEKGDYAAAAAAFGATEGKLEIENRRLYARSLKALNRIEEAVAQLEKVEKEDNRFRRGTDRYYIQYLRKKAEAGR
jgi:tetratricopeptide (TPR) repeat protein